MANGVQLATAYISLNVRTDGIKGQIEKALRGAGSSGRDIGTSVGSNISGGIRDQLSGGQAGAIFTPLGAAGASWAVVAGRKIGATLRTAIVSAVSLGVGAALLGAGTALSAGLARLQTLQQSRIQLSLKLNPQEISQIQTQIGEIVTGTNVTLDEAMAAVPKAINSKMSVEATKQYVKDVADAAAATGGVASFGWLDEIFTQVRNSRALLTDEIQQLTSAGLDIRGALKDAFGWDDKTLDKNLKRKKVGIEEVQQAIQKVYGEVDAGNGKSGLAQLLGTKTLDGSIKAAKASIARIGADFISAIVGKESSADPLEDYAMAVNKITDALKGIERWIKDNRGTIRQYFLRAWEIVKATGGALGTVADFLREHPRLAQAIPAAYVGWKTIAGVAALGKALGAVNTMLKLTLPASAAQSAAGMNAGLKKFLPFALIAGTATAAGWLGTEIANGMDGRDLTWMERFDELKKNLAQAFTSENVKKFFSDAKRSGADFVKNLKSDISTGLSGAWESFTMSSSSAFDSVKNKITAIPGQVKSSITKMWEDLKSGLNSAVDTVTDYVKDKFLSIFGPDSAIGKILSAIGFGTATANAASPSAGRAAPFNPGPRAPGAFGDLPGRAAGLAPGTRLDGSDQRLAGVGGSAPQGTAAMNGQLRMGEVLRGRFGGIGSIGGGTAMLSFDKGIMAQDADVYCGPAAAQVLLSGNGIIEAENVLAGEMGTGQSGTPFGGGALSGSLNKRLPDANFTETWGSSVGTDQFFKDIENSVKAGFGAVLNFNTEAGGPIPMGLNGTQARGYSPGAPIQHYVAVTGVDSVNRTLQITDSMADGQQYTISAENAKELINRRGYVAAQGFGVGGRVSGAGHGTSDSIPAMLSNGEHVLTAADVKKMGGQDGVYAFRSALQQGLIPGFNNGGAVDPSAVEENINDLANRFSVDKARMNEVLENEDSSPADVDAARRALERSTRLLGQARADAPILLGGGTPPDRSDQNRLYDITDQLAAQNNSLKALQEQDDDVPDSQMIAAQYGVSSLQREREKLIAKMQGGQQGADYGADFVRSLGFIPAAAGSTGVAGTSSLSGFIDMGASVVGGLIDTGVNLGNMAVSAAIAAGAAGSSFGAGAAAAPAAQMAASYGLQMLGNQGKTIANYWFGLAGIGADALMEQMSPFGMPRWLGYDYTNFAPQLGIQEAALSTVEKMGGDAITKHFAANGQTPVIPGDPTAPVNTEPSGASAAVTAPPPPPVPATPNSIMQPGDPGFYTPPPTFDIYNPNQAGGGGGGGSWAKGGHVGIYDNGGVLKPGELAFNASRTPESILTKQQWNAMAANASTKPKDGPLVENLYAQDMQDALRQLEKVKRRDMMQYAGRP